jgi:hypothetical protein
VTSPRARPLSVRRRISHACATHCIHVPLHERICPKKNSR